MSGVYIKAAGMSKFGKSQQRLIYIIEDAVKDMGHSLEGIDAVYIGMMNPEAFIGIGNYASFVADRIGLPGVPSVRIETASSTGAAVLFQAYASVKSGLYKNVLVIAAEKMTHLPTPKVTSIISEVIDPSEKKTGASMPALAAMVTNRFIYENKISLKKITSALGEIAIKSHHYGCFNEYAQFRKEIDIEKYLESRFVSEPLRLYDCSPISDGAVAVIISSEKNDIEIAGVGQGTDKQALCRRKGGITSFASTRKASAMAYNMAGFGAGSIHISEMHDAFTPFELMGLVETGLIKLEDALKFYKEKNGWHDGILPVNISGGLKSRGHPVGASGLAQVVEAYKIMMEKYPPEIMPKKYDTALAHSIGGLATNNFVTILKRRTAIIKPLKEKVTAVLPVENTAKDKRYRIYSSTRLYTPPEGIESPHDLVILQRKDKLIMAVSKSAEVPKIGRLVHVNDKIAGNLVVKEDSVWQLLGFGKTAT